MKHSSKEQPSTMMIKLGYNFLKKRYFFSFKITEEREETS